MKAKITTLFLAVCTVLLSNAQYCTPTYTNLCTSGDLIDNFTFSTLSNLATGCNGDTDNYSFDTTITTVVYLGNTYNISMQSGPTWPQGFGVWIDYNQDGDFGDAGEFVYASPTSATTPFNSTVTIPAGAAQGTTRLRVRCAWSTILTWADTCNLQTYGEMEDYEITITPPPPIDGGVTVITSPISDCALSSSENVVVDIANFGSDTIFGLSVYYSINGGAPVAEVLSDTILPGNTLSHLFSTPANLLATGSYFFDAWAGITGDTVALNDSTVNYQVDNQAGLSSFPYMEDFDPLNLITQSANDDMDWTINSGATASTGTGPNNDTTSGAGFYMYTEASGFNNMTGIMESPCIDITVLSNPTLSFWYHMFGADMGNLYIDIFSGGTWVTVDSLVGQQQATQTSPWLQKIIDLSSFSGIIKYAFRGTTGNSFESDMAVDDILVSGSIFDLGVTNLVAPNPTSSCALSASETIAVDVVNFGNDSVFSYNISYSINGGAPVTEVSSIPLAAGDTITFTFVATADFSALGTYNLLSWTTITGDADNNNDTIAAVINKTTPITAFPFIEDFEGDTLCGNTVFNCIVDGSCPLAGNWINALGDSIDWSVTEGGTPSNIGPSIDHTTGTPTGNYIYTEASGGCNGQTATLWANCLDISSLTAPYLEFWYHMFGINMGNLYVDVYSGGTWTTIDSLIGQQQPAQTDPWLKRSINLSTFSGVIDIRFRGVTGVSWESDISVDDIMVYDKPPLDLETVNVLSPQNGSDCNLSSAETIVAEITNVGSSIVTSFDVSYSVNGGAAVTETVVATLNPGDTLIYAFTQTVDLSATGVYDIDVWSTLIGDSFNLNDTASTNAIKGDIQAIVTINTVSFGNEVSWEIIDSLSGVIFATGSGYSDNSTFIDTICLITGATYAFNAFDGFGDGWNGGTYSVSICGGSVIIANNGDTVPDNGTCCTPPELESVESFTVTGCPANDAGVTAIPVPKSGCDLSASSVIIAEIQNFGSDPITTTGVSYSVNGGVAINETFTGSIPAYGNALYTFSTTADLSAYGTYTIDAWTSLTGDTIPGNDSISITITNQAPVTAFPYMEDFDSLKFLVQDTINDDIDWTISSVPTPSVNTGPDNDTTTGTGNYAYTEASGFNNMTAIIESPCIDISSLALPYIQFYYHMYGGDMGTLDLEIHDGISWINVWSLSGNQGNLWQTDEINLAPYSGVIRYRFVGTTGPGFESDMAIDDILVYDKPPFDDLEVSGLVNPQAGNNCELTASESITATITSNGSTINGGFTVSYSVNGGPAVTESVSDTILAGSFIDYTFSTAEDFSAFGTYTVDVWVTYAGDTIPSNDSIFVTVINNALPTADAGIDTTICAGGFATIGGSPTGPAGSVYSWSPAATLSSSTTANPFAFPSVTTTYFVIVTDSNGCADSDTITITVNPNPTANAGLDMTICAGDSAQLNGSGGTSYSWSPATGLSDSNIANPMASPASTTTYTLTATDANGCTGSDNVTVTVNPLPSVNLGSDQSICAGSSTVLDAGGGFASYTWNDGSTNQTLIADSAGTYYVDVTDANGCLASDTINISILPAITLTAVSTDAVCGATDGTASVSAGGGASPFSYNWSNSATTDSISGLSAGTYFVTVTDANGCSETTSTSVNNVGGPSVDSVMATNVSCNGDINGTATVTASGGTTPYTYAWSDGQTNATATGLAAGSYSISVTDGNSCVASSAVTISEPAVINTFTTTNDASCGGSDGSAAITSTGGTIPYTYQWDDSNNQTNSIAVNLSAGTYHVTVTDTNGCTAIDSVIIANPVPPTVGTTQTNVSCSGGNDGNAAVTAIGGNPPYSYAWSDGQTTAIANNLSAGTHSVIVTDSLGCTATASLTITEPAAISLTTSSVDASCGASDGSATVTASGGTPSYSYQWDDPSNQINPTANNLASGIYNVTVTDANGCAATASATVNNAGAPTVSINGVDVNCPGGSDGSATGTAFGGASPYSYSWDDANAQTDAAATGLIAGSYNLTVTDAAGCSSINGVVIGAANSLPIVDLGQDTSGCNSITLDAGAGFTGYSWSDGSTIQILTANASGSYSVMVTDSNGCSNSDTVNVTIGAATVNLGADTTICGGSITLDAGSGYASYAWSDSSSAQTLTVSTSGTYSVTVTDTNGCTASDAMNVTIGAATVNLGLDTTICGGSIALDAGAGFSSYAWSTGETTQSITVSASGTYSVTVTDANGCTASDAVNVTVNAAAVVNLGPDTTICDTLTLTLDAGAGFSSYAWSTGESTQTITVSTSGTYVVTVTGAIGCPGSDGIVVTVIPCAVGINETGNAANVHLFPNPTNGLLNVELTGIQAKSQLEIMNVHGQVVYSKIVVNQPDRSLVQIDLSGFAQGIYYLRIETANHPIIKKVIVH